MNTRIIMRVEIDPNSKTRLDEFCNRTGMTKVAAASRLIDWFGQQPDTVQAIIQGLFPPPIEADAAKIILKHLVAKTRERSSQIE
jgi:hypothetical protein